MTITNATKAGIILVLNGTLGLVTAFGVSLSDAQQAAVTTFANAVLGMWVLVTYTSSRKRIP